MRPPPNQCQAPGCPYLTPNLLCPTHSEARRQLAAQRIQELNQKET